MNIDIGNFFKEMATIAGASLQKEGKNVSAEMLSVLDKNKQSLSELVEARCNGDINEEEFNIELQREKQILEAEMISLEIISKSDVQKIMNSAIDTLTNAVKMAI